MFCDIISQEMQQNQRVLEVRGDFIALCPYAPRVPYETWIIPRTHEAAFERFGLARPGGMLDLGALLRRLELRSRLIHLLERLFFRLTRGEAGLTPRSL